MVYLLLAVASGFVAFNVGWGWAVSSVIAFLLVIASARAGVPARITDEVGPACMVMAIGALVGCLIRLF